MNTKAKIGIAVAIVLALVGIIVLDKFTPQPKKVVESPEAPPSAPDESTFKTFDFDGTLQPSSPLANEPPKPKAESKIEISSDTIKGGTPSPKDDTIKGQEPSPPEPPPAEYTIQAGDRLAAIAEKKYGNPDLWPVIVKANPGLRPETLRIGQKIKLPARAIPEPTATPLKTEGPPTTSKTYTIMPGDTLSSISKKIYGTTRYTEQIYKTNTQTLKDKHLLTVGTPITLPEIAPSAPESSPIPGNGSKTYTVKSGDSLWKIAEQFANTGTGILPMMDRIADSNRDKLAQGTKTMLKVGWVLSIPEEQPQ